MNQTEARPFDIEIHPSGPLGGYVIVPPSKNYTTRLVLTAALAEGRSVIHRPATNEDARALVRCCRAMGAKIAEEPEKLIVDGVAGRPVNPGTLNPGNAGAVLRFLLGAACLIEGEVRFETDHADSLGRRPNRDLLAALEQLGAQCSAVGPEGLLPITIHGGQGRVRGGPVSVSGARSSQFLSSLLLLAPHLEGETEIEVTGADPSAKPALVSAPLIDQTLDALGRFGAEITASEDRLRYRVQGGRALKGGEVAVPGDWPSGAALMSAVAVAGGMVSLSGLDDDAQGERRTRSALEAMGCRFTTGTPGQLFVHSAATLAALDFDGDLATDAVLALEAAAVFAEGTSRFSNIANLRIKESNRIEEPLEELAKLGVEARCGEDWVEISGRPDGYEGGVEVDCRGDHRIAQMLAIVGTRCARGLRLKGADCVAKSYPTFFEDLAAMGVKMRRLEAQPAPSRA